ncbi:unnamed protein product, partial [Ectocarpus sp. 12 AP-2014]
VTFVRTYITSQPSYYATSTPNISNRSRRRQHVRVTYTLRLCSLKQTVAGRQKATSLQRHTRYAQHHRPVHLYLQTPTPDTPPRPSQLSSHVSRMCSPFIHGHFQEPCPPPRVTPLPYP